MITKILFLYGEEKNAKQIFISTHTQDEYRRNLATYHFNKIRFIHINGVRH